MVHQYSILEFKNTFLQYPSILNPSIPFYTESFYTLLCWILLYPSILKLYLYTDTFILAINFILSYLILLYPSIRNTQMILYESKWIYNSITCHVKLMLFSYLSNHNRKFVHVNMKTNKFHFLSSRRNFAYIFLVFGLKMM